MNPKSAERGSSSDSAGRGLQFADVSHIVDSTIPVVTAGEVGRGATLVGSALGFATIASACSSAKVETPVPTLVAAEPTPTLNSDASAFAQQLLSSPTPEMRQSYGKFYEFIDQVHKAAYRQFGDTVATIKEDPLVSDRATFEAILKIGLPNIAMTKPDGTMIAPAFWDKDLRVVAMPKDSVKRTTDIATNINGRLIPFSAGVGAFIDTGLLKNDDEGNVIRKLIGEQQSKIVNYTIRQFAQFDGDGSNPQTVIIMTPQIINGQSVLMFETQVGNGKQTMFAVMDSSGKITPAPDVSGQILIKEKNGTLRYYILQDHTPTGRTLDPLTGQVNELAPATATPGPTSAPVTATPASTNTVEATATLTAQEQFQNYLQSPEAQSWITQYANDYGLKPADVSSALLQDSSTQNRKDMTGNTFQVKVDSNTGVPLLVKKDNVWQRATLKTNQQPGGPLFSGQVDGSEKYLSPQYQQAAISNLDMIFPSGSFMPDTLSKYGSNPDQGNGPAQFFSKFAHDNNLSLFIHPGFWNFGSEGLKGKSNDEVKAYMQTYSDTLVAFAKKSYNKSNPPHINIYNEPLNWYPGFLGWQDSAFHDVFQRDVLVESYVMFYNSAIKAGLQPGKDVYFGISETANLLLGENDKAKMFYNEFQYTQDTIAKRLGIPVSQVQLDLTIEARFDTHNNSDMIFTSQGRLRPPTAAETKAALQKFGQLVKRGQNSRINISEINVVADTEAKRMDIIDKQIVIPALQSGTIGVISFEQPFRFSQDAAGTSAQNVNLFNSDFQPTQNYFELLKAEHLQLYPAQQ